MKKLLLNFLMAFIQKALNTFQPFAFAKNGLNTPADQSPKIQRAPFFGQQKTLTAGFFLKHALKPILAGCFLFFGFNNANASITFGAASTAGFATSPLTASQAGVGIFGFSANSTGNYNIGTIDFTANVAPGSYFSNFKLYVSTTNTLASAIAGGTIATNANFFGTGTTTFGVTIAPVKAQIAGTFYYYFVVADFTLPTAPGTFQMSTVDMIRTNGGGGTYAGTTTGTNYVITPPLDLGTATTVGLATAGQLNITQAGVGILGFSVTTGVNTTVNSMAFSAAIAPANTIGAFFSNVKLYVNNVNNFGTAAVVPGATVSALTGTTFNISGLAQTINTTTKYYFIVADYTQPASGSTTFTLSATSVTTSTPTTYTAGGPIAGITYTLTEPTLIVADLPAADLTGTSLVQGQTNIAVAGVSMAMNVTTTTLSQLIFTVSPSIATENLYFATPTLVTCPTAIYNSGTATVVPTAANVIAGTTATFNISPVVTINTTTKYFFLVLNYTVTGGAVPQTFTFNPTSYTSALTGTISPSYTANTYTCNPPVPVLAYTTPDVYTIGTAITPLNPNNTVVAPTTYAISGGTAAFNTATGLTFTPATGVISGTPSVLIGSPGANYTITATNAGGSTPQTINITINPPPPTLTYTNPAAFTQNVAITAFGPTTSTNVGAPGFGTGVALAGGTLNSPYGMAINPANSDVYVTNYNNNTVSYWNSAGTSMGVYGTGNPAYSNPAGIVFDAAGNGYVLNRSATNTGRVYKFNAAGAYQSTIITGLNQATGLAIDASGNLYIADGGAGNVYEYSNTGTLIQTITGFNTPVGVAIDGSGNIYVLDRGFGARAVYKFSSSGTFLSTVVGGLGNNSYGLSIDATGNIFIGDSSNTRVREYNAAGTLQTTINVISDPRGMVADSQGNLYVSNYTAGTVTKYPPVGGYFITAGTLPPGLIFNTATGFFSGTPTTTFSGLVLTVGAYNAAGTIVTANVTLNCNPPAPALTYSTPNTYATGAAFTLTPANTGGAVTSCTIAPALPAGVTISATGVISGSSAVVSGAISYTVTATGVGGVTNSNAFTIAFAAPPSISYTPNTAALTAGTAMTTLTPANSGGAITATFAPYGAGTALTGATLSAPYGAGKDPTTGYLYITDFNNGRVDKFGSTGTYISTFSAGYTTPIGIVFDSAGNAYIADRADGNIYKVTPAGVKTTLITTGFSSLRGISIDAAGNLYIISGFQNTVEKYSTAGTLLLTLPNASTSYPTGVAVDAAGNIYVVDRQNNNVVKFNSAGVYQSVFATGFNGPYAIAINASGNVYVSDTGNNTIDVYSASGSLLSTVTAGLNQPTGIVFDNAGDLIVANQGAPSVLKFAPTGNYSINTPLPSGLTFNTATGAISGTPTLVFASTVYTITAANAVGSSSTTVTLSCTAVTPAFHYTPSTNIYSVNTTITPLVPIVTAGTIGAPGFGTGIVFSSSLNVPQGIGTDAAGNIYVANSGSGNILKYSSTGTYLGVFVTGLNQPMGIVFDSSGNAYILDTGNRRVYKYSAAGALLATLNPGAGTWGTGDAFGITIDASNNLYVSDINNSDIIKFNTAGTVLLTVASGPINGPAEIVVDASGNIYEVDNGDGTVYKYNALGAYVSTTVTGLNNPFGLAIDGAGNLYVGDSGTGTVTEYTPAGAVVTTISGLTDPQGLLVDGSGNVYVTDATNNTLTKYPLVSGYTLSSALPPGLSFNNTTGTFSGTPTTVFGPTTYTITGYGYGVSATTTVTLSCVLPAPAISYTPATDVYCTGTQITPLLPVNTGGPVSAMTFAAGTSVTGAALSGPYGVGTDASGNIYVANSASGNIVKYNSSGVYQSVFSTGYTQPVGIVFDAAGNAYVLDRAATNNGVVYKVTGGVKTAIISPVNSLRGIAIDASNNLYITSGGSNRIYKYSTAGALITTFPTTYTAYPTGVAVSPAGNVYVLDRTNGNVIEFTAAGVYISTFASGFNTAYGLYIDAAGNVYVADSGNNQIDVYGPAGTLLATISTTLNGPYGLTTDGSGNIYVSNFNNNTLYKYVVTGNFTISPALPAGLLFNTTTGAITGLPTALSAATNYTVSCHNATATATTTVNITVSGTPVFTYTTPDVYNDGTAIAALTPTITGGTPASYSVSPALPTGLSLNASTGVITGTPTVIAAAANYIVTGTNTCGIGTFTVNITCNAAPIISYPTPDVYTKGTAIAPLTPTSTGGAVVSYSAPTLPAGLIINAGTGVITGTPTAVSAATNYIVTATNTAGSVNFTINITCKDIAPVISYTTPDVYTDGTAIAALTPTSTGGAVITYSAPTLPAGLSINAATGVISGTPTAITPATNYVVTATNSGGSVNFTINITCNDLPPAISYTTPEVYNVGGAINPLAPTSTGGAVITYSAPTLPAGLTINTATGVITGTPTTITPATNYIVTATNGAGSFNFTINITVNDPPPAIAYNNPEVYNVGTAITPLMPGNVGGAAVSYSAPSLPPGLSINTSTGVITGTPTVVSPATNYVITATNTGGSGSFTLTITCNSAAPIISYANPDVYTVGTAIPALTPVSTGGAVVSYSAPTLPAGLSINAATGIISGTPTAITPATNYTVTATNNGGSAIYIITITCNDVPPVIAYTTPDVYTIGTAIAPLTPSSTGGAVTSYNVSSLPAGLSINTSTGVISGTPTTVTPAANYIVTASNSGGSVNFTINIACNDHPPIISYTTPDLYNTGTAIAPLTPTSTGGAVVTYTAASLPAGLTINAATGVISGTPTTATPATNYMVTATNSGGSANFTINITVQQGIIISYTTPDVYTVGTTITPLNPNSTGSPVVSYSVSPSLPAGLSIDPVTGIISGTVTTITAGQNYFVTATNSGGSVTFAIYITVNLPPPVIAYTTPDVYTVGMVIAPLVPANSGGTPASYSVSPALPAGLTFNTATGVITGTPTAVSAAANYVVAATNAGGTGTFTINITCNSLGPVFSYTTPDVYPVGAPITPLSPNNTGSTPTSYAISGGTAAFLAATGLTFNTVTGVITGTPPAAFAATVYTITATDGSANTGTATITLTCGNGNDWVGGTSTDWNTATNWSSGSVPLATDIANIGINVTFTNFPNVLAGASASIGSVQIGTLGGQAGGVVVNSGSTLTVAGGITYQSDPNAGTYVATISGAGTVNAASINVAANTTLGTATAYTETMASSVSNLNVSSNISLTSTVDASSNALNATFNITGGTVALGGVVQTSNGATSTSTLSVAGATLQLSNISALSGLSATGINTITFNNAGATIEYSGAAQTYYTDAAITGLAAGPSYTNIKFSGTGVKSPNGTAANNVNIAGDFTNALTINDATDYIDFSTPAVIFNGTTQNIYAGNGTGTTFYNTIIATTGTATIQSGSANVASTGVLTMSGTATLATGGLLTLNSDINGTAMVAQIPGTCIITGNVNVQRYLTGGAAQYRGYRLLSSPVSTTAASGIYELNYVKNSCYLTGTTGVAGGFDGGGNPTLYLMRENLLPNNTTFTGGNYRGINNITSNLPGYNMDIDNGPFNLPVGNGFLFFFRGDRSAASFVTETKTTYVPTATTLTATGVLNQGSVSVNNWFTGSNLLYTTTSGDIHIEGFNLVGNPYPSSIDWDTYSNSLSTNGIYAPNVGPFLYILNSKSGNYNVYHAGNGGVGTVAATGSNVIPSGQGFFVVAGNASATLTFNENAKTNVQATAAQGNLFLGTPPVAAVSQYLRLGLVKDSLHFDGSIINFNSSASTQYVRNEDAPYRKGNGTLSISSLSSDNIKLAINNLPLPNQTQRTIPLDVRVNADGQYSINLTSVKSIPALFEIWLKDGFNKDSLDIRNNPAYAFNAVVSDTTTYANRFSLVIRQNPALMVHLLNFTALKKASGDQVVWVTENEQNYTNFTVERSTDGATFNVLGGVASKAQGTYSYNDNAPVIGANMYRLKIQDLNGTITYSNVVTIQYANTGNTLAGNKLIIYPNPAIGPLNLSIPQGVNSAATAVQSPATVYDIKVINNLGSVVQSKTTNSQTWQTDVSTLIPGTYILVVTKNGDQSLVGKGTFVKL